MLHHFFIPLLLHHVIAKVMHAPFTHLMAVDTPHVQHMPYLFATGADFVGILIFCHFFVTDVGFGKERQFIKSRSINGPIKAPKNAAE